MSRISVKDAVKRYGNNTVIPDLDLEIGDGELFTLLGPSGCGKTTLLRMIAGFNSIEGGDIFFNEKRINDMDPSKRNIGMVFQNYAIFPNLSVRDNVAFGLKNRKVDKAEIKKRTDEFLNLMQIMQYADRMPNQLSGGQQQRIALARALVISPDVLLMDEPLSNLDAKLRVEMRSVIRHTQKSVGITTVYVTHDQEEAMAISDRIAVMKDGVIQHVGTPRDIYQRPKNVFVATFIGRTNIVNAHVKDGIITFADGYHEHIDALDKAAEQDVRCSIRPEEFIICKDGTDGIHGTVQECTYLGLNTHYTIDTDQGDSVEIVEESSIGEGLKKGEKVLLKVKKEKINVFTKDGGTNLIRSDAYEMFLAITESKKIINGEGEDPQINFEKHKIFLYKEDFHKFINGLTQAIQFIEENQHMPAKEEGKNENEDAQEEGSDASLHPDKFKIDIDF